MRTETFQTPGETRLDIRLGAGEIRVETAEVQETTVVLEPLRDNESSTAAVENARVELRDRGDGHEIVIDVRDRARGLDELARVARRRVVVVTWDPSSSGFWLVDDYFPEITDLDRQIFPTMEDFRRTFGRIEVRSFPVPHDCIDGFMGAYWRRPHAYLDPSVRASISAFAKAEPSWLESGLERLRRDLAERDPASEDYPTATARMLGALIGGTP